MHIVILVEKKLYEVSLLKLETICSLLNPYGTMETLVVSAFEDDSALKQVVTRTDVQAFMVVDFLSAQLAGKVARLSTRPVFGLPVAHQLGGLDTVFSMVQMPTGFPLGCLNPEWESNALGVEAFFQAGRIHYPILTIDVVMDSVVQNYEFAWRELKQLQNFSDGLGVKLNLVSEPSGDYPKIIFVHEPKMFKGDIIHRTPCLLVPLFDHTTRNNPSKAFQLFEWIKLGGVWMGINNACNALSFFQRWYQPQ